MAVLTISRESGSLGSAIALEVAQRLGYHFMDKKSIGRILEEYGLVEFGEEYDTTLSFWARFDARRKERREEMVNMLDRVILGLAQHDNMVIVGRCGFAILSDYADVLNVRIQAPFALRVQRVMDEKKIERIEEAREIVRESDQVRAAFVESFYGKRWNDAQMFDLVLDTGKIPADLAVNWLVEAVQRLKDHLEPGLLTTASIEQDPILTEAILDEIDCKTAHSG